MISVIIPTMWRFGPFPNFLRYLTETEAIGEIIIINNDYSQTPPNVPRHPKIKLHNFDRNTYVNPAWNYGASVAKYEKLCFLNDDVLCDANIFGFADEFLSAGRFLVVCRTTDSTQTGKIYAEKYTPPDYLIGFGSLMFILKTDYIPIPDELKIFCGDNWLFELMYHRHGQNYYVKDMFFYSPGSATLTKDFSATREQVWLSEMGVYHQKKTEFLSKDHGDIFEAEYATNCMAPHPISVHLPLLRKLATECDVVNELGTGAGISTSAFLVAGCSLKSYDMIMTDNILAKFQAARTAGKDAMFYHADAAYTDVHDADMVFIDTLYTYELLLGLLRNYAPKTNKYIVIHGTARYKVYGELDTKNGLEHAIIVFLTKNPGWRRKTDISDGYGLTILERLT